MSPFQFLVVKIFGVVGVAFALVMIPGAIATKQWMIVYVFTAIVLPIALALLFTHGFSLRRLMRRAP